MSAPLETTVRRLFAWSMNQCAFPDCVTPVVMPDTGTIVADVCHIRVQSPGGPRYDQTQSDDERRGVDNLVLMCKVHHKVIDADENLNTYTVEILMEMKQNHERVARESGDELSAPGNLVHGLILTTTVYESGSVHNDFRNAYFKVGGDGGTPVGPGGGGGVLVIVGVAALPNDMHVDLDGGNGAWPGGGSGGGGALQFEGRPMTQADLNNGLTVPLFYPADSITVADGLMYVLGAGWEYFWVQQVPFTKPIAVGFVINFDAIVPNTLLRFEIVMADPSGPERILGVSDAAVPESEGMLNRACKAETVQLNLETAGVHTIILRSGAIELARYSFEVRLRDHNA